MLICQVGAASSECIGVAISHTHILYVVVVCYCRAMENYEEAGWSAMSNLEEHLQALENEFTDSDSNMCKSDLI